MTARDRIVIIVVGAVVGLAAFWFLALAPKREEAKSIRDKVAQEQSRLQTARQAADAAEAARRRYDSDYATVARLGKAVPSEDETATLVYQLETAARKAHVDFRSIKLESSGSPTQTNSTPAGTAAAAGAAEGNKPADPNAAPAAGAAPVAPVAAAAATLPPGASVGPAGFPTMPFSFTFEGTFFNMERFLREVDRFTRTLNNQITVNGRLLTVDGVGLVAGRGGFPRVKASVRATAYLLPADQGLTAGATPAAPGATAGATTTASATPGAASPAPAATATGVQP